MKERKKLHGIIPAMITPFDRNGCLDLKSAATIAEYLINEGVHGLFIAGTNGEAHLMNHDEVIELTKVVLEVNQGRVPIISGAGRCSTDETITLSRKLNQLGVDYISLVSPYYLVPNQIDLFSHYSNIAKSVDANFILYNIPSQTGLEISPEIVGELAKLENICGIKDSGGNLEVQKEYIALTKNNDFDVLNGSDSLILKSFLSGAKATVAATANVIPKLEIDLYNFYKEGRIEDAQNQRDKMDVLRMSLKKAVAPSVMKKSMELMGLPAGIPRLPITEIMDQEILESIEDMLDYYEELDWS